MNVDIFSEPLLMSEIELLRDEAFDLYVKSLSEDKLSTKVVMYCPIPIVDLLAGLAVAAVEESVKRKEDDPRYQYQDVTGGCAFDWSNSDAAEAFVDKIKKQGREMIVCEFMALREHITTKNNTIEAINYGLGLGQEIANDLFKKWTS